MKKDHKNKANFDDFIRQVFKDDLPPETNRRMQAQLDAMREKMIQSQQRYPDKAEPAPLARRPFRQEVLAWAAFFMVILGSFLYINGSQSTLTGNISALGTSVSVIDRLNHSESMECSLRRENEQGAALTYHIQWRVPDITRIQIFASAQKLLKTLWITSEHIILTYDQTQQRQRLTSLDQITDRDFLAVMNYISPQALAEQIDGTWRLQEYQGLTDCEQGNFSVVPSLQEKDKSFHLSVDLCTYLPILIRKIPQVHQETPLPLEPLLELRLEWNTDAFRDDPPGELRQEKQWF